MSRTFSLIVLCPNGRRETIKITPNNSILQVLEEACSKQHLKPEDFDICHYNKALDLSLPIRFANLPNNALLELRPAKNIRKESLVTVGLQLESGERFTEDFLPSSLISDVIEKCLHSRTDTDNLQEKGEIVCIYMRQTLSGDALKTTSLRSLGLTEGKAIIRLLYRKPEELEHQAHVSTPLTKSFNVESLVISEEQNITNEQVRKQPRLSNTEIRDSDVCNDVKNNLNCISSEQNCYTTDEDCIGQNVRREIVVENVHEQNAPAIEEKDSSGNLSTENQLSNQNMVVDDITVCEDESFSVSVDDIKYIGERHAVLYSLDHISDIKKADLPDEFFELTVDDVKYLLAEYKRTRDELENQPLLTKEQRQRQMVQKLAYYHQAVIRVYFPEKLVLQAVFMVDEKVQAIYDFVRNFLENKDLNFYLYITPPKEKLSLSKTILESMLVPAAVIYFGCEAQQSNFLDKTLLNKLSDPRAASLAASESRKQSLSNVPIADISENVDDPAVSENANENFPSTTAVLQQNVKREAKKIPKWLKLSKQ